MIPTPPLYFYPSGTTLSDPNINANAIVIDGSEKLIIDPGLAAAWPELERRLAEDGHRPESFGLCLLTHSHPDHLEAGLILAKQYGVPLAMSGPELDFLQNDDGTFWPQGPPASSLFQLAEEGPWSFGGHDFQLGLTPGHSPGGLCLHWPKGKVLVTGDVYFPGTFGATDYPGGDEPAMFASLERLEALSPVELVLCGHGRAMSGHRRIEINYRMMRKEAAEKKARQRP